MILNSSTTHILAGALPHMSPCQAHRHTHSLATWLHDRGYTSEPAYWWRDGVYQPVRIVSAQCTGDWDNTLARAADAYDQSEMLVIHGADAVSRIHVPSRRREPAGRWVHVPRHTALRQREYVERADHHWILVPH